jgi:hypothetical protein
MKRLFTILSAAFLSTVAIMPAIAKNPNPIAQVSQWTGTWNCGSGKSHNTETFVPLLNGKGMHVTVTGPQASEGVAAFDSHRNAWFYTFVNADGTYATWWGPVTGPTIAFKQVFPAGGGKDTIRLLSASKYSSVYSFVVNHRETTSAEVCTKS